MHGPLEQIPMDCSFQVQVVHQASLLGKHVTNAGNNWIRFSTLHDTTVHLALVKHLLTVNGVLYFAVDAYPVTAPSGGVFHLSMSSTAHRVVFSMLELSFFNDMCLLSKTREEITFIEMPF